MQPYSKHVDEKGLFLLIHNFNYGPRGSLEGSQKDADAIRDVVAKLDFNVILKENLTAEQIIRLMEDIKKNKLNNRFCLWVYVLAHGNKGQQILGVDYKYVSVREHIMDPFLHNCSQLTNKPKLFFVDVSSNMHVKVDHRKLIQKQVVILLVQLTQPSGRFEVTLITHLLIRMLVTGYLNILAEMVTLPRLGCLHQNLLKSCKEK
ncbi:caspase-3-like [Ciona intestinalis]